MYDWNDLRFFLAVVRAGTTLGAARELGVGQTTVARRISALERSLGVVLFERRTDGYRPTQGAQALVTDAEDVERGAISLASKAASRQRAITGIVRLTSTEAVGNLVLAPMIAELQRNHPGLLIELISDDRKLDLSRGEADGAIRIGSRPDQEGLVIRRLPDSVWSLYCSGGYAAAHGVPTAITDLEAHPIVLGAGGKSNNPALLWLRALAPDAHVAARVSSIDNLIATVRSGAGVSALPDLAVGSDPAFVRCLGAEVCHRSQMWLVHHQAQKGNMGLRVALDATVKRFEQLRRKAGDAG